MITGFLRLRETKLVLSFTNEVEFNWSDDWVATQTISDDVLGTRSVDNFEVVRTERH